MLLHNVDKPGSDVDEYVKGLDQILLTKMEEIQGYTYFLWKYSFKVVSISSTSLGGRNTTEVILLATSIA